MPRPRHLRSLRAATTLPAAAVAAAVALAVAGCAAAPPADVAPEPTATLLSAPWTVEPESDATPTPAVVPPSAADAQATADIMAFATSLSATVAALESPAATREPAVAVNTAVPIAGCAVPTAPPAFGVGLSEDAPDVVQAWWAKNYLEPRSFDGEVSASDEGGKVTRVRSTREGATFEATIRTDVPLPLAPGRRVHVIWHNETSGLSLGGAGLGYALFIGDDGGLVALFLARSMRRPAGQHTLLLDGEQGGLGVQQLRSPCLVPQHDVCGFSLYAAPVQFTHDRASLTLGPGESGVLASPDGGPSFNVRVATSHFIVAEGTICADGGSWPLSYSIVRK